MSDIENEHVIDDADRAILREILDAHLKAEELPLFEPFRIKHRDERKRLDALVFAKLILVRSGRYCLAFDGFLACQSPDAKRIYDKCQRLVGKLREAYIEQPSTHWTIKAIGQFINHDHWEVERLLALIENDISGISTTHHTVGGFSKAFLLSEAILDTSLPEWPEEPNEIEGEDAAAEKGIKRIERLEISGYRPFQAFSAALGPLTVLIGANASGKSSLFYALRLLSFAAENPLPPGIDPHIEAATTIFHVGGPERIDLGLVADLGQKKPLRYEVSIQGPLQSFRVTRERLATAPAIPEGDKKPFVYLDFSNGKGAIQNPGDRSQKRHTWSVPPNELVLRRALDPSLGTVSSFQAFVASFRFYGGFDVSQRAALRRPVHIEENPMLAEDGSNLSAVLGSMILEHKEAWEELELALRSAIPSFESIGIKPRGGRGMAMGVWRERGLKEELSLGDLSEGTLRLLCWLALAYSPHLPPVICIDEPELGLHPRVLPVLAGALKIASSRAQILIATHSPHFLAQFDLEDIAVMRKEDGHAVFVRPKTSQVLRSEVEEIGGDAIARLFISEELEVLP